MKKAAFLDRDGIINKRVPDGYILRWQDFQILPGVAEAISLLNHAGFLVIVVTNQRCIAKDLLTLAGLDEIHKNMTSELASKNARLDAIYFCPHGSDQSCTCRKPAPGMLITASKEHNLDLGNSWMIGDTDTDIAAGRNAGCKTIQITENTEEAAASTANLTASSLLAAVKRILPLT
ncbi:MAG TPA: HAD family hydrolase [Candidatus Acidoferrum sp.]|jgi:D-glycero-D-manno-heptose 1,7-bisphosphate phosphatase